MSSQPIALRGWRRATTTPLAMAACAITHIGRRSDADWWTAMLTGTSASPTANATAASANGPILTKRPSCRDNGVWPTSAVPTGEAFRQRYEPMSATQGRC
jgi:hypothetical protein